MEYILTTLTHELSALYQVICLKSNCKYLLELFYSTMYMCIYNYAAKALRVNFACVL